MIACLEGQIWGIRKESIILMVGGIGYELQVSRPEAYLTKSQQFFLTYMQVREDAVNLFGFPTQEEYELFKRLIEVKGIGPKTALNMLGAVSASEMLKAIELSDVKALKALPGIGAKTASQIILDLKGKVVLPKTKEQEPVIDNPVWESTKEALLSLGYRPQVLTDLEKEMAPCKDMSVDAMLRKSLQWLAARNGV